MLRRFGRHGVAAVVLCVLSSTLVAGSVQAVSDKAEDLVSGAGDEVVTATADADGYHLFAASKADGWVWHSLATLQPAGYSDERWTGSHCMTGDGRWVVAVVAPWHANNSSAGFNAGGIAYAVDAHTGAVRPLLRGVSLAYFNPGCGAAGAVALTQFAREDQGQTRIVLADPATGATRVAAETSGEVTSAVPALDGVVAARGNALVAFTNAGERRLATLPGAVFGIHPNAAGGVDLLTHADAKRALVWTYRSGKATRTAGGALQRVHLFAGRSGHNILTGADPGAASHDLRVIDDRGSAPEAVSLDGNALLAPTAKKPQTRPQSAVSGTAIRVLRQEVLPAASAPVTRTLPTANPKKLVQPSIGPRATGQSIVLTAYTSTVSWQDPPDKYQSPRCAIPRNDPGYQVIQPGTDQIQWAAMKAVTGSLTSPRTGAPNGLGTYVPSTDFPKPVLAGNAGVTIPVNIVWAILAQESNWDQASWHVARGAAGNPLTADYYGVASDPNSSLNYDLADCGYGLGQLTSLMRLPQPGAAPTLQQQAIAVDYQENIAAAVSALGAKWNELYNKGITLSGGNAGYIENWYFAIWAYNSGLQPSGPQFGNTTGCDPGPSCTDPNGNWGLGFANNPANPGYDPQRSPFLRYTYDDARTPSRWPYQEKVFGWMEFPLRLGNNIYYPELPRFLNTPDFDTFCVAGVNNCTFNSSTNNGTCADADWHCWWHQPVTYVDCSSVYICQTGADASTAASSEPAYPTNNTPGVCDLNDNVLLPGDMQHLPAANTIIVDDEAVNGNTTLRSYSCPASGRNWHIAGTFTPHFAEDPDTGGLIGQVDWHQYSAGFGGHLFFTHTIPLTDFMAADAGIWDPQLTASGYYQIRAFIPAIAAGTGQAHYHIDGVIDETGATRTVDRFLSQQRLGDEWADLGFYHLAAGATVTLTTLAADGDGTDDIAFDAMAFIPITSGSYVSLGDSYSAGEGMGLPPFEASSDIELDDSDRDLCHRNLNAYSRQYALQTTAFADRPVVHLACSGANIDDILGHANGNFPGFNPDGAGNHYFNEPYQLGQIPPDARLVTLSIGGNDVGFSEVMRTCVTLDTAGQGVLRCKPAYTNPDGTDRLAQTIADLAPKLLTVYQAVRAAAPNAHIVVLTYPQIFNYDPSASDTSVDCSGIGNADRRWLSDRTNQLDDVIKQQAQAAGLDVLDERDAFDGHQICDQNSFILSANIVWQDGSYHPSPAGYEKEAADLKAHLAAQSIVY